MFETRRPPDYAEIFDARGRAYHQAMCQWPQARGREFAQAIALADLRDGQVVCDYPSGGGYLAAFVDTPVHLVLLETSRVFLDCAEETSAHQRLLVREGAIPLPDASVDRVLSVAGLHHVTDKRQVFQEVHRCLKPGGRLVVADVAEGSGVGQFLNEFVDQHSDDGHEGTFLDATTARDLESCGYRLASARRIQCPWQFASPQQMVEYCRLLFGISRASPDAILEALQRDVGVARRDGAWELDWELLFLVADTVSDVDIGRA